MPKLGEYKWLLDNAFFMYPSAADAENGKKAGGTGFLFALPSERWPEDYHHIYGITNWHVACRAPGAPVIRINRHAGRPVVIELRLEDWHYVAGSYDVAAAALDPAADWKVEALGPSFLLTDGEIKRLEILPGEDAFMLRRFVDYDGIEVNAPSMRFGNISIMSGRVKQETGWDRPSIC